MSTRKLVWILAVLLLFATACNADNTPTGPDQTPGGIDGGEGGANDGLDAQQYRPLYRQDSVGEDQMNETRRYFPFNRGRLRDNHNLDSRRLRQEENAFSSPLGFSEYNANDSKPSYTGYGSQAYSIDRELLADLVAQVVVGLPDVDQASVLVTDQYCLIGYSADKDQTNEGEFQHLGNVEHDKQTGRHRQGVKERIQLSGQSVVPGWYKVYTTDDPRLKEHIRQIADQYDHASDTKNLTNEVNALIKQMDGPVDRDSIEHTDQRPPQTDRHGKKEMDNYHKQGSIGA